MRDLHSGYTSEIETVDEQTWCGVIQQFDDANIYQTWSYDAVRCHRQNISHFVLKENGAIVAAAQARIVRLPFIGLGIAYIRWGPLWRIRNAETNVESFRQALRALRNEYVCKRGLVLRVYPLLFNDDSDSFASILEKERFSCLYNARRDRTILIDLRPSLEELRKGLDPKWRRELNLAERNGLEIISGSDDELFVLFIRIYREMLSRKRFVEPNDINEFRSIQRHLRDNLKMRIMLCRSGGEVHAGLVCSAIGTTGIYLFGATSNSGMKSKGSYLLQWRLIEWLKEKGCSAYDLNGIDPVRNPGTYRFKDGLCGRNGRDVYFLGRFESYENELSYACVKCGEAVRGIHRAMKRIAKGVQGRKGMPSGFGRNGEG